MISSVQKALKQYWGYDEFFPLQSRAVANVLDKRDCLVVMPTGGGKSICYQSPAVTLPGIAVVVSPLISLMTDQVSALNECGIPAARIDSTIPRPQLRNIHTQLENDIIKILYVSPERLAKDKFLNYLKTKKISLFAIDEAHCLSMWGHDFRPEYRQLSILKENFPDTPIHAYTATANQHVRDDIINELHLTNPDVLIGSFDRPNLTYTVTPAEKGYDQITDTLDKHKKQAGIIYCIRRKDVDDLFKYLSNKGYKALPYHAGLPAHTRKLNQDLFINDQVDIIIATIAFGMGIDKSNVRYVIHAAMPKSIENYQQESGRAGRDGLPSQCYLYYSGKDYSLWKFLIGQQLPPAKAISLKKLSGMYEFCHSTQCRHKSLVNYFGQAYDKTKCSACDVCLDRLTIAEKPQSRKYKLSVSIPHDFEDDLFEALRKTRKQIADTKNIPAFVVFSDAVLVDMAAKRPSTPPGFLQIKGVGLKKHKEYAEQFLQTITGYCTENNLETDLL